MKENFDTKNYRDNLAKDLKDIRENDPEKAQQVLEEEQKTIRYQESNTIHAENRKGIQDKPKLTNEIKEKNELIIKTFKFYVNRESITEAIKKGLQDFDLTGLENTAIVCLENNTDGRKLSSFYGVDITENIVNKNEADRILMYGFAGIDIVKEKKPKVELLLAKDNISYLEAPFTPEDIINKLKENKTETIGGVDKLQGIQDREILEKVSNLIHEIHAHEEADGRITMTTPREMPEMVKKAKEYFPSLVDKTDDEIVKFLFGVRKNVPEVMKGQNIEGVFCDIEGTLFNGKELNQETLSKLKQFEGEGKNITLWTDGDTAKLQELLNENGITYPLKSKIDFAGASAEIVFDNDDHNTFSAKTKIFAKKFIKI